VFSSLDGSDFSLFLPFFNDKMAAIMNFDLSFTFFFQKAEKDPRRVIVWKFQGPRLNGQGATEGTDKQTNKVTTCTLDEILTLS